MTQPLFYSPATFVEKTAGEVDLPDDPNQWAQQILQELYKQVPYITDYQPHVQMSRVDAERGYGMGHVEIQNQTEAPLATPEEQLEAAGIRTIRIPFVIREKKLSPFDLLINDTSATVPLTENRLRQALFRPQAFDVTSRTPGDQSMIGQLYPPYRQNYGFGGGGVAMNAAGGMGLGKVGSALEQYLTGKAPVTSLLKQAHAQVQPRPKHKMASILAAILPTLDAYDGSRVADEVNKCAHDLFRTAKMASPRFTVAVEELLSCTDQVKHASWENLVRPDVVQIQKVPSGYAVKTASHRYWEPKVAMLGRGEVVHAYGAKAALEADLSGSYTVAHGLSKMAKEEVSAAPQVVTKPGAYKVMDSSGKEHVGYVVPGLVTLSGEQVPLSLFTNGSVVAVQSEIQGVPAGDIALPSGPIGKAGAFFSDAGDVRMTVPLDLQDSVSFGDQPREYHGTSYTGEPAVVAIHPNVVDVTPVEEGRALIPAHWKWLPLDGASSIQLLGGEQQASANPEDKLASVEVVTDGISFSFRGVPLTKMASTETSFLDVDGAMFLLAGLGVDLEYGMGKLAEAAAFHQPASIKVARVIERKHDLMKNALEKAAGVVDAVAAFKQPILLKEAASFPDPQMVDTVLSLGFINPENIMTFVSYLPDIEDVQTKMCEILFAVRLGLSNVPQSALERSIRSTEEVIEGLKILGFQGS